MLGSVAYGLCLPFALLRWSWALVSWRGRRTPDLSFIRKVDGQWGRSAFAIMVVAVAVLRYFGASLAVLVNGLDGLLLLWLFRLRLVMELVIFSLISEEGGGERRE